MHKLEQSDFCPYAHGCKVWGRLSFHYTAMLVAHIHALRGTLDEVCKSMDA